MIDPRRAEVQEEVFELALSEPHVLLPFVDNLLLMSSLRDWIAYAQALEELLGERKPPKPPGGQ